MLSPLLLLLCCCCCCNSSKLWKFWILEIYRIFGFFNFGKLLCHYNCKKGRYNPLVVVVVTVVNYGNFGFWKIFGFFPPSQPDVLILEN